MHEFSLARAIVREVDAVRTERRLGCIQQIMIELGEFSGVEPELLRFACDELSEQHWGRRVELVIQPTPLEAECRNCRVVFRVRQFQFRCPDCGTADVRIARGEELNLISIAAEPAEAVS